MTIDALKKRITVLEAALNAARIEHATCDHECSCELVDGNPYQLNRECTCDADDHNAAIDAALKEVPE